MHYIAAWFCMHKIIIEMISPVKVMYDFHNALCTYTNKDSYLIGRFSV